MRRPGVAVSNADGGGGGEGRITRITYKLYILYIYNAIKGLYNVIEIPFFV